MIGIVLHQYFTSSLVVQLSSMYSAYRPQPLTRLRAWSTVIGWIVYLLLIHVQLKGDFLYLFVDTLDFLLSL